jgi:hypothetical protein
MQGSSSVESGGTFHQPSLPRSTPDPLWGAPKSGWAGQLSKQPSSRRTFFMHRSLARRRRAHEALAVGNRLKPSETIFNEPHRQTTHHPHRWKGQTRPRLPQPVPPARAGGGAPICSADTRPGTQSREVEGSTELCSRCISGLLFSVPNRQVAAVSPSKSGRQPAVQHPPVPAGIGSSCTRRQARPADGGTRSSLGPHVSRRRISSVQQQKKKETGADHRHGTAAVPS